MLPYLLHLLTIYATALLAYGWMVAVCELMFLVPLMIVFNCWASNFDKHMVPSRHNGTGMA